MVRDLLKYLQLETTRHICRGCYNRARAREQAAIQILPGAIPLDEVEPVDVGLVGRCLVCGLQVGGVPACRQRDRDLFGLL